MPAIASRRVLLPAALALTAVLAGCGGEPTAEAPSAPVKKASVIGGASVKALPAPKGDTILKISGVEKGNTAKTVSELDMKGLETLPAVEATVREPFLKRDVRFSGVRVGELLKASGTPDGATKVFMHALDDYTITLGIDELVESGAILATRADGKRIPISKGGPIRVVYDEETETSRNTDLWIWSVDTFKLQRA
jgi:hypothetical protein